MKTFPLGGSPLVGTRLAYGCWRVAGSWNPTEVTPDMEAKGCLAIRTAFDAGFTFFDHADIYCHGRAESIFGRVLRESPELRARAVISSKCGIRVPGDPSPDSPYRYDFSASYILKSCEDSLRRLGVETIDLYLLHRPDYLADPQEVASAFERLRQAGKVREFGVSNFRPSQLTMLQKACPMRLRVNQVEISLAHLAPFEDGTIDQCLAENLTPLAWSPLAGGLLADGAHNLLPSQQGYKPQPILAAIDMIARAREVSRQVVALAWLLRHPAGIVPIVGSIDPARIREAAKADDLELSRDEWYRLLEAARGDRLP
jgi:predicted oxidoreductase